jgi:hypothetical protein
LLFFGVLKPLFLDLLEYRELELASMRALPFPDIYTLGFFNKELMVYFAPCALFLSLFLIVTLRAFGGEGPRGVTRKEVVTIALLFSITAFYFTKGWVRTQGAHMLLANIPALLLIFTLLNCLQARVRHSTRASRGGTILRAAPVFITLLIAAVLAKPLVKLFSSSYLHARLAGAETIEELPALGSFSLRDPWRLAAANYIVSHTGETDKIVSATGRHDKLHINDASIYFVTQRMPAIRWQHYDPGVQTTFQVQQSIIAQIKANTVPLVMIDSSWDSVREPNRSSLSSDVGLLDVYLADNFDVIESFGNIRIGTASRSER